MPPDAAEVSVTVWLVSNLGEDGVIAPAVNADLTVTVSPLEHAVSGVVALSVTL